MTLRVVMPVLSLALVLVISHSLGTEGLGLYTLVYAYLEFFTTLTPLGLNAFLTREGARSLEGLPDLLGNTVILGTASSLVLMPFMSTLGIWLGYNAVTRLALTLMSLAILPSTLLTFFEAIFVSRERVEYIAIPNLVEYTVKVGLAILLLSLGYGVNAVMLTFVGSRMLAFLLSWVLLQRIHVPLRWAIDYSVLRHLVKVAPTFLFISLFAILYWRIDVLMLSMLRGLTDVGHYGAAYRIMEIAKLLPQSFCMALYPHVAHIAVAEPWKLKQLGGVALRYLWVVTLPVAVGVTLLGGPILDFFYGEGFRPATITLSVLIWTVIPYALVRYYAYVLVAANRQRVDLGLNAIMSAVNVILNLLLIPQYGSLGAALSTSISICLYAVGQYIYMYQYLPEHLAWLPTLSKPVIAGIVMGICIWWSQDLNILLVIAMASVIYFIVLLVTRFFDADELHLLHLDRFSVLIGFVGSKSSGG
jgi:O-antigen/teichoic acid export membrane protein